MREPITSHGASDLTTVSVPACAHARANNWAGLWPELPDSSRSHTRANKVERLDQVGMGAGSRSRAREQIYLRGLLQVSCRFPSYGASPEPIFPDQRGHGRVRYPVMGLAQNLEKRPGQTRSDAARPAMGRAPKVIQRASSSEWMPLPQLRGEPKRAAP